MPNHLALDLWSDFVCGHCYYGTRRIADALELVDKPELYRLRFRSFQLDPRPAAERPSGDLYDYLAQFNGSRAAGRAAMEYIKTIATADGLPFNPDLARPGNTTDAHRLVHLARQSGRDTEIALQLYKAYWSEGLPIADRSALTAFATAAGLNPTEVERTLNSPALTNELHHDQHLATQTGIRAVPALLANASTAPQPINLNQPPQALATTLTRLTP
ncbi:DsbA family oxidoreductase [Kribbella hippodromi]|uniref:DsbA family oxidoreductase n=1 Tax=Kribbella hippodromi TaxID=434347 RepID=A0ABP4NP24_9ACTN